MRSIIFLLVLFLLTTSVDAQNYGSCLSDKITTAHNESEAFQPVSLFTKAEQGVNKFVKQYQDYKPLQDNISKLCTDRPGSVSITLYAATGIPYTLELVESHPTSADASIGYINERGRFASPYKTGLHYNGVIKGMKKSVAAMSVFDNGEVMIFFSCDDGNFNMGQVADGSGTYVLYNSGDRLQDIPVTCLVKDSGGSVGNAGGANKTTGLVACKKLRVYWECANNFYQDKGSLLATQNYLLGIFNFMQSIYYNDGIAVEMSGMYIWTTPDAYATTNASDALFHFMKFWQSQNNTFYGDQAHLITLLGGWQGVAYLSGMCANNVFAASNLTGQQSTLYPVYDVDIFVVSHETGHNIGAVHSQSCSWNTGPGGSCGSIDNCVTQEPGSSCGTCPYQFDANATGFKGTIMSYCMTKVNLSEGFGQVIGGFLRNKISSFACLQDVISAGLMVQDICNSNDGAITLHYKTGNLGNAPYSYVWSNGLNTKDITHLAVPGKYYVTIKDANNCTINDSAYLKYGGKPGEGLSLPGIMPYCCKDTSFSVTITATLPLNLTGCQSVAWLRTKQPLTSPAAVKAAYANASAGDLLKSDNDSIIDNTISAALTIQSPPTCDSVTAYYYTPYITRRPVKKAIYSTNAGSLVLIYLISPIGSSIILPAEPSLPAVCEKGLVITDTITVTISSYTGRANKLTLRVIGADKKELFRNDNLPGDGTYRIPVTGINDHFQEMTLKAYDFNCVNAGTCTGSSLTMQAVREVTYDSLPPLTLDSGCLGSTVYLSFGPDSCNLDVHNTIKRLNNISLYPNPTRSNVIVKFNSATSGKYGIVLQDITGKILHKETFSVRQGEHKQTINTGMLSGGVYTVTLLEEEGFVHTLKLVIQ